MQLHRALSVLLAAAALTLGLAGTSAAGMRDLEPMVSPDSDSRICIGNGGKELTVAPTSSDADLSLVLILPKSADAEKISLSLPSNWIIRSRVFQEEGHALLISLSPTQPLAVKARSVAACFDLVGIRTDELGPIGLSTAVHLPPETAPRARR